MQFFDMDQQENCLGATTASTRPSKKRPMAMAAATPTPSIESLHGQLSLAKKRVVLGDLINTTNITNFSRIQQPIAKPRLKITTNTAQEETAVGSDVGKIHASPGDDDLQKYSDIPLIYHHLRSLEVINCRLHLKLIIDMNLIRQTLLLFLVSYAVFLFVLEKLQDCIVVFWLKKMGILCDALISIGA